MLKNTFQNIKKQEKDCEVKMKIESLQNTKVKEWLKLKEKKYRDRTNLFLIEGDHLIKEAQKKGVIKEVITTDESYDGNLPHFEVTGQIMKKLSEQMSSTKIMAVCEKWDTQEIKGNICILDNLQDPGNLGTIIRSALALGIDTIILSHDSVDLYNEKVIRASEGMIFHLNFIRSDLKDIFPKLKELNYAIYGTNVLKGTDLKNIHFADKRAIIIGNEGNGMKKEWERYCDTLINIPLNKKCESLNAGVAASIIFYEMKER